MFKKIFFKGYKPRSQLPNIKKYFCTKNTEETLPILVEDPFMPYGCNLRYIKNDYLYKLFHLTKDKQTNLVAFFHDKKKNKVSNYGVECSLNYYDASGEIVITSTNADRRVMNTSTQPILPMEENEEIESLKIKELRDNPEIQKNLNYEVCKNIVSDINKVLYSFLEISSRQNSMDNPILREIHGNVSIMIQNLLKQNMDFLMEISKPELRKNGFSFSEANSESVEEPKEEENFSSNFKKNSKKFSKKESYPEGLSRLNKLIFKTFQDFLKISKNFKKTCPINEVEDILKCTDPFLRTKLLIENIYNLGDYILKELHIYEEYKKDSAQKHEKFFLRFAKKYIEQVAGSENFDDYKDKLEEWEKENVISEQVKKAIELELKQAFSAGGNDMEMEEKKKTAIVEEIFSFPWDKRDNIEFDTKFTKKIFNENLYGMETVKERIFEYVAKLKRTQKNNKKGFVILISGSPGVGKTTVAQLIGEALKRKTGLINLAGENDTIKLKGSRRTYVDSQPSVFFKELVKLGVKNPVLILDEIDKVSGNDHRGHGAASTLLELLNPEENHNFTDLHLNIPLDFSEVIFICTANETYQMLEPLLDRIEVIHIDEYTLDEKKEISEKFLIPSVLKDYGLDLGNSLQTIKFTSEMIEKLIKEYSYYRGGIRGIKKNIEKIIRKANNFLLEDKNSHIKELQINEEYLNLFLGNAKLYDENQTKILKYYQEPGSVLTADQSGQLIRVFIKEMINPQRKIKENEAISSDSIFKDLNKITNLDKPVEESLQTALILAREKLIDIFNDSNLKNSIEARKTLLREYNLYMTYPYHKKKGNSYGLAFLISFISAGLNKKIDNHEFLIAGELSPHGNVLRIRGIRSLLNVCEFYNIRNLVLPEGNRADYMKFIENNNKYFNVKFVKNVDDALKFFFKNEYQKINSSDNIQDILLNSGNYVNTNVGSLI